MRTQLNWPQRIAIWGMLAFGAFGSMFVIGEIFTDPGGTQAFIFAACWLVPQALALWFALARPDSAWLLMRLLALIAVVASISLWAFAAQWQQLTDANGPIFSIYLLVAAMSIAAWGLHEPKTAGRLLLVSGLVPLVVTMLSSESHPIAGASLRIVSYAATACGLLLVLSSQRRRS